MNFLGKEIGVRKGLLDGENIVRWRCIKRRVCGWRVDCLGWWEEVLE